MSHVLIVEDHEENRNLLKVLLEVNGYRVSVAGDGLEALASARRDPPDAVVSDALMPNMDGFALCRAWMQDAALKAIPFIFYSATYVRPDDAQFAAALGAVRYLIKPLEAKAFLAELEAVLREWTGRSAPAPASPLDELAAHALHESALTRKLEDKMAQLEAANAALRESEARFRSLTEMSSDFYWESDAAHRLVQRSSASKKASAVSVFERGAQIGERRWEIPYLSPDEAGWAAHRETLDAHLPFRDFVLSRLGSEGDERFISISGDPVFDAAGAFIGYRGVGTDITGKKRAENDLRASEERWKFALEGAGDGVWDRNLQTGEVQFSKRWKEMLGYADEEIASDEKEWLSRIHPEDLQRVMVDVKACTEGTRTTYANERRMRCKDGSWLWVLARGKVVSRSPDGRPLRMIGTHTDITERKRAEQELHQRTVELSLHNQILQLISQDIALPDVLDEFARKVDALHPAMLTSILLLDADGKHLRHGAAPSLPDAYNQRIDGLEIVNGVGSCGAAVYRGERVVVADVLQHPDWLAFRDLARSAGVRSCWSQPIKDSKNIVLGVFAIHGREPGLPSDAEILLIENYANLAAIAIGNSRAEAALRAAEEQYRGLIEQSIAGTYIIQDGKFAYMNPRGAEILGYASPEELIGRDSWTVVAEKDRELHAENIRRRIEGEIDSISYEFTGLRKDGSTIDVGVHGARATHKGRLAIIGMMQDISEKKRAEDEIKRYVAQVEAAFMSTVQVATTMGEMRDPYTAGHQRKVAEIAVAIGAELGFDARRQEGLRVAGYLHDIGKIRIPAEILSKPGKLSLTEFRLVQGHADASYEVLKDVNFPWPVAQVARQHHERMDGSGYPQGLKGKAIILEARIVAVADVIEAMSSHRPYRPGLGMDAALAEIERGRGSSYDTEVVDACLQLYREQGQPMPV
ncbi:MAG: PAS domain S-box protein [Burkholderiales bacterium]|nr:PAS domain S-box protein [Burkholderiales bacterium]